MAGYFRGRMFLKGLFTWTDEGRSWKVEQLFVGLTCRNFGPCGARVEKVREGIKTVRDKNKNAIGLFCSLYWR